MELKEIWDLILPELTQRSYRLMRENDQEGVVALFPTDLILGTWSDL